MKGLPTANQVQKTIKRNLLLDGLVIFSIFLVIGGFAYMILNPGKMKSDVRNSDRNTAMLTIIEAMKAYVSATGNIPSMIPLNRTCASIGNEICKTGISDCKGYVNLTSALEYTKDKTLPIDEFRTNGNGTGYYISHDGEGSLLICSPLAERNVKIELKQFMY
jgi:hypothetical protein